MCVCAKLLQLCPTLCDPMDSSLPGSFVNGILQARILEWVSISFSRTLSDPGIEPMSPAQTGGFFTTEPPGKPPGNMYDHLNRIMFALTVNKRKNLDISHW